MEPLYLHLRPGEQPPPITARQFRAVIVTEQASDEAWRSQIAEWLVDSGCLYLVAWGVDCVASHDSVDWALLTAFDFGEIPDDRFIMTTWHDEEPLSEAFWFAGHCASHPTVALSQTILMHVTRQAEGPALLRAYRDAQEIADG